MKKITLEIYQSAVGKKGIRWAGNQFPKNTKEDTFWKCPNGHEFFSTYNEVIVHNMGCLYCRGYKRIEDYTNYSRDGIKWVGIELPRNVKEKTSWQCSNGHVWQSNWDCVIGKSSNCPKCPVKNKKTQQDYKNAYHVTGIKWMGEILPKDIKTKTIWECQKGHTFHNSYYGIVNLKIKCSHCPKSFAKTIEDYQKVSGKDGAHWIGIHLPKDVTHHTTWKCVFGHTWNASYRSIVSQNSGCPICQQSVGEFTISKILNNLGIKYTTQKTFPKCRYKYVLPFDFYFLLDDKEYLIEYDGIQHFSVIRASWSTQEKLEAIQARDLVKTQFALDNGFTLIRIPYMERDNIEAIIKNTIT